jgi:hypothetical protein
MRGLPNFARVRFLAFSIAIFLLFLSNFSVQPVTQTAQAADNCQMFPETGFQVCGKFLQYWQSHGGLAQQGFPISNVFLETNAPPPSGDGQQHKVQYFQRARFEEHTENAYPNDILLGLLGSEQFTAKYAAPAKETAQSGCQFFSETGFNLCGGFLEYWQSHGGLAQQGFPISAVFSERNAPPPSGDGQDHLVQCFQRARFEQHNELTNVTNNTLLGLLGSEQFGKKYSGGQPPAVDPPPSYPVANPTPTPAPTQAPAQSGYAGVKFLQVNGTSPGRTASVEIQTKPGLTCSITYIVPSGRVSTAKGLDPEVADSNGEAYWSWLISGNTGRGTGTVRVSCGPYSNSAPIIIG